MSGATAPVRDSARADLIGPRVILSLTSPAAPADVCERPAKIQWQREYINEPMGLLPLLALGAPLLGCGAFVGFQSADSRRAQLGSTPAKQVVNIGAGVE